MIYSLKAVEPMEFIYSDRTIFDKFKKTKRYKGPLKQNEAYLFISMIGNQLLFVLGEYEIKDESILDSRRLRISRPRAWTPELIRNCAKLIGIEIEGIRRLDNVIEERREERNKNHLQAIRARRKQLEQNALKSFRRPAR